ncbi:MAG: rod shape-determining protein RodA [Nannocystis sp.]|uniref:rod shape-determining protein RodA n=1 Tax=Nannocystis sp. TaxID=1962667 RepID=UPI0024213560|nr:rod shape-determining protein RodA [Nannocystis sp.]MBK9752392.1 rod shape-determining protein RodA [Nannocystis sp.]
MTALGRSRSLPRRILHSIDWVLVTLVAGIVTLALINLNSAGAGDWTGKIQTQIRWIGLGTLAAIFVAALDYRVLHRVAYAAYIFGLALLGAVPIFGVMRNEARRWLEFGDYQFQPSELMKILLIMALARYISDLPPKEHKRLRHLVLPFAMFLVPVVLIVNQPDLSTGIISTLVAMTILALTELTLKALLTLLSAGVGLFMLGWGFFMHKYQRSRIDVWLNPEAYADNEGYQTIQAMIGVGNGGFLGRGVGQGTQNVLDFLPYGDTDFPFAVYAEEWGFVGAAMVLTMFACLVLWAINLASQARDRFGALLCVGVASMFFWHVSINVGMVLQLLPVTGITIPLFSLGGSNALAMMLGIGILMSVSRSRIRP